MSDDYLWDPQGEPDPNVAEMERLLGRFAHDGRPLAERAPPRAPRVVWVAAAAAIVLGIGGAFWWFGDDPVVEPKGLVLRAGKSVLQHDEWFEATATDNELELGDGIGDLKLSPGSRLQVKKVTDDQTLLYLQKGHLHAFVQPDVKPRFFQVDTPTARCVDLGCEYDLKVDDDGYAFVSVSLGQIAFELDGREVFVPRGAECRSQSRGKSGAGLGLPHFSDCEPRLAALVRKFDAAFRPEDRRDVAEKIADAADRNRDTLTLYHLMLDEDAAVQQVAEARVVQMVGYPDSVDLKVKAPPEIEPTVWREHLETWWW